MSIRRLALSGPALVALLALALTLGCSNPADGPAVTGVDEVIVRDGKFMPPVINVPAGTTVTWRFEDGDTPHDVKGDGFRSPIQREGTYTFTFSTPGSYPYHCTLHSNMTGRVIVTD